MSGRLKVLVVDDDWTAREALVGFLGKREMEVWQADCRAAAEALADPAIFDVAILDIVLPDSPQEPAQFDEHVGVELARSLCQRNPRLGIVFLSAYMDRGPEVIQLFMDGHDRIAYLLKGSPPKALLDAIQQVTRRGAGLEIAAGIHTRHTTAFDLALSTLTPDERQALLPALPRIALLTPPERRVFVALGSCMTRQGAANQLGIVVKTVDYHLGSLYEKLMLRDGQLNQTALLIKLYMLDSLQQLAHPS
jgi:DNA-binding NarL/FixJ family response regulator